MSIEFNQKFNQTVKRVDFYPFEWSANLIAISFADHIKVFTLTEATIGGGGGTKKEDVDLVGSKKEAKLNLISSVAFQHKIEHFSWSPKTYISTLKPIINDNSQNLAFCSASLSGASAVNVDFETTTSNIKTMIEKFEVDCIYGISFDHQNGDLIAINADNYCYLWDLSESKLKAKFVLQSPGVNICWNRDDKNKFMVGEKSGTIRIFSLETLKPVYSLMSFNENLRAMSFPLIYFDWSQIMPETIVAITNSEIFLWNSSKSCFPERTFENYEQLKYIRLCHFKENLIGFVDGHDACSKLTVLNFRTNQTVYQSKNLKLLNSFSFHSILPLVAVSNEQQVTIAKING